MKPLPVACAALALLAAPPKERRVVFNAPVNTLTALPGERVTLQALDRTVSWTAPLTPGFYPIHVVSNDNRDSIQIQAFVLVPASRMRGEYLNGYRIGRYPDHALRGLAIYRPPVGFIEVTRENENTFVSAHFQLKQFLFVDDRWNIADKCAHYCSLFNAVPLKPVTLRPRLHSNL